MSTSSRLTADIRRSQETEVLKKLQAREVEVEDYAAIATNGALLDDVVSAIIKHRLFTSPEEQVSRLLKINEQVWKDSTITEAAIRDLGDPPSCPASDDSGLFCVMLFSETGDAVRTFERNWLACQYVHGENTWKWDGLRLTPQGVRARANAQPRLKGIRWQVCELGREFKNQRVQNVRLKLDSARRMGIGQELPAVAAMHPKWAVSMNGDTIPFVDAPDLEVVSDAGGQFGYAPCLSFDRDYGRVKLSAERVGGRSVRFGSGSLRQ